MTEDVEVWKPVVGFEGWYEVSSDGRVKRVKAGRGTWANRILKPHWSSKRRQGLYCDVTLCTHRSDGKAKLAWIHVLVAAAFIGPRPPGKEINHKDGSKRNNHASNLEYVTPSENRYHAMRLGLLTGPRGERCRFSKLTEIDVKDIRILARILSYRKLARLFDVEKLTIYSVVRRRTWSHIP